MSKPAFGALILAAGLSSRMGSLKPIDKIDDKTLLEHCVTLFNAAHVDQVVTVVGHRAGDLIPELEKLDCRYVINADYNDGMFSSIQAGVQGLADEIDAFFLLPVDIPLVSSTTVKRLQDAYAGDMDTMIFHPTYKGRRGHPPLISAKLIAQVLKHDGTGGMRTVLQRHSDQSRNIEVEDPFILLDADTPEDLSLLERRYCDNQLKK